VFEVGDGVATTMGEVARFGFDEVVFNEDGDSVDFRVESSVSDHAFFIQGIDGVIGVGTSAPAVALDIVRHNQGDTAAVRVAQFNTTAQQGPGIVTRRGRGSPSSPSAILINDELIDFAVQGHFDGTTTIYAGLSMKGTAAENWSGTNRGAYWQWFSTPSGTAAQVENMAMYGEETVFNDGGAAVDFRVEGANLTHLLFVDASADSVGIGTSTPSGAFHVSRASGNSRSFFEGDDGSVQINVGDEVADTVQLSLRPDSSAKSAYILYNQNGNEAWSVGVKASDTTMYWASAGELGTGTDRLTLDASGNLRAISDAAISVGAGNDLSLSHNGTNSVITNSTGELQIAVVDNTATSFVVLEGSNLYIDVTTTNGSEAVNFGNTSTDPAFEFKGTGTLTVGGSVIVPGTVRLGETTDPTAVVDTGFVYTKDDGGDTELFYRDGAGNIVQLTADGAIDVDQPGISAVADEAITAGMLVSFDGGGTNGEAFKAVVTADGEKANVTGVAKSSPIAGGTFEIATPGEERTIADALWDSAPGATDIGKIVYASVTTNGEWTLTAPSTGGQVRIKVGVIAFADASADTTRVVIQIGEKVVL
jgi:hypothetical protein